MDLGIAGKWALVCAASKGLGLGCAQALALFPGVSRSGSTITAGLFAGLTREAAARFSFLLMTPITSLRRRRGTTRLDRASSRPLTPSDLPTVSLASTLRASINTCRTGMSILAIKD